MSFPPAFLDELRARVSLVDVVGRHVQWDRRKSNPGRNDFWACCPFHSEKTPSFHVEGRRGFYHCFGCGVKGDAVGFLMEVERLSFREAVEALAHEAGMALPEPSPQARQAAQTRRTLHDLVEVAAKFFEAALAAPSGATARDYIARRGLTTETVRRFRLGFASASHTALRDHLGKSGATPAEMAEAGLVIRPDDGRAPYDRFRDRLIFPILDARGRPIAFGGRALGPDAQAKYLNSPEGPLFRKSGVLYNLGNARREVRADGTVIVVEGYMDVIALDQAGLRNAVAPLGTALTEEHLALLWRVAAEPVLCFDGDEAGQRAARHAMARALPLLQPGRSLRVAFLPNGMDPDDLVRAQGKAGIDSVLGNAMPLADMVWRSALDAGPLDTPERRAAMEKTLLQQVGTITEATVRGHYLADMRARLDRLFARGGAATPAPGGYRQQRSRHAAGRPAAPPALPPSAGVRGHALARADAPLTTPVERLLVLTALLRPELLLTEAEALAECPFADAELGRLRDALVARIAHGDPEHQPDGTKLRADLVQAGFGDALGRLEHGLRREALNIAADTMDEIRRGWKRGLCKIWEAALVAECREAERALEHEMTDESWARFLALRAQLEAMKREMEPGDPMHEAQNAAGASTVPRLPGG